MYYKLEKPKITKGDIDETIKLLQSSPDAIHNLVAWSENPLYRYWDTLKYKAKADDIRPEIAWQAIKFTRNFSSKLSTPVRSIEGTFFKWSSLARFDAFFHEIDMSLGGTMKIRGIDLDERHRHDFITRGVMEEAIASSQLEGANTARKVAKKMLLEGRKPKTKSEKMIVNNYKAMVLIEEEYKHTEMSLELLLRLHEELTIDTMDDPKDCGRLRTRVDDTVHVIDGAGTVYHTGPEPRFVKQELAKLIEYANKNTVTGQQFTHPVIKAIILHFWIGYLHPFIDGNGRLARTLFYWSLLRDGYWGFTYLPISRVIKESATQYGMAYVYTEQDDYDFTYFLDYHLRKIEQALRNFREYVKRKAEEHAALHAHFKKDHDLNERQVRSLQYLRANNDEFITTRSYGIVHNISNPTAVSDVANLVSRGFLRREKKGRTVRYYATELINTLFT